MDIMTAEELKILLDEYPGWHVSLLMPTPGRPRHRAGPNPFQEHAARGGATTG